MTAKGSFFKAALPGFHSADITGAIRSPCTCQSDIEDPAFTSIKSICREFNTHSTGGERIINAFHPKPPWKMKANLKSALIYSVTELAITYFDRPTKTDVTVGLEPSLDFPAVTICNENPVRLTLMGTPASSELNKLMALNEAINAKRRRRSISVATHNDVSRSRRDTTFNQDTGLGTGSAINLGSVSGSVPGQDTGVSGDTSVPTGSAAEEIASQLYSTKSSRSQSLEHFQFQFARMNDTERMDIGHNITAFLVDCIWQGYPCDSSNFTMFSDLKYGNCYIFNSGMNKSTLSVARGGHSYGLSLQLYIEQEEYLPTTESAGVRVTIHEQNTMPFAEEQSIVVGPGKHTSIGISKKRFVRIDPPYGECKNHTDDDNVDLNAYSEYYNLIINYSREACYKTCLQEYIIRNCGCAHPGYPKNATALWESWKSADERNLTDETESLCNIANNTEHINCVQSIVDKYREGEITCSCTPKCLEDIHEASISSMRWPSDVYQEEIMDSIRSYVDTNVIKMRKNVVKLEIFYRDMNLEVVTTSIGYTLSDLGSDLGGNLGLWLGVSVLTACELLNLILDLCLLAFRGSQKQTNKKNQVAHVNKITTKGL